MPEIGCFHFSRAILPTLQLADARGVDIESNDRETFARKGNRDRQPHITQADNCDLSSG
jgi:hypothetical protein